MKKILFLFFGLFSAGLFGQVVDKKTTVPFSRFSPTTRPQINADPEIWFNVSNGTLYKWNRARLNWEIYAEGIEPISGNVAPLYAGAENEMVINGLNEIYRFQNGSWVLVNGGGSGGGDGSETKINSGAGISVSGIGTNGDPYIISATGGLPSQSGQSGKFLKTNGSTASWETVPPTAWADITGKPSTFPPSSHTHPATDITGLADVATSGSYDDLSDTPLNFYLEDGTFDENRSVDGGGFDFTVFGANDISLFSNNKVNVIGGGTALFKGETSTKVQSATSDVVIDAELGTVRIVTAETATASPSSALILDNPATGAISYAQYLPTFADGGSITGLGLPPTQGLKLVGDEETPSNSKYYGTDGAGVKGFHDLPSGSGGHFVGNGSHISFTGSGTVGDPKVPQIDGFSSATTDQVPSKDGSGGITWVDLPSGGGSDGNGIYSGSGSLAANTFVDGNAKSFEISNTNGVNIENQSGNMSIGNNASTLLNIYGGGEIKLNTPSNTVWINASDFRYTNSGVAPPDGHVLTSSGGDGTAIWQAPSGGGGGGATIATETKSADQSITGTTLANVTNLSKSVTTGQKCKFSAIVKFSTAGSTSGISLAVDAPATNVHYFITIPNTGSKPISGGSEVPNFAVTSANMPAVSAGQTGHYAQITGYFTATGNGDLQIKASSSNANAVSVKQFSTLNTIIE